MKASPFQLIFVFTTAVKQNCAQLQKTGSRRLPSGSHRFPVGDRRLPAGVWRLPSGSSRFSVGLSVFTVQKHLFLYRSAPCVLISVLFGRHSHPHFDSLSPALLPAPGTYCRLWVISGRSSAPSVFPLGPSFSPSRLSVRLPAFGCRWQPVSGKAMTARLLT